MLNAFLLIFNSRETWERIARARRSPLFVFLAHLLPLLLVTSFVEGYGLHSWGKWQSLLSRVKLFPLGEVILFEAVQLLLTVAIVLIGARLVQALGETFHGRHTYSQAFTLLCYGMSPFFLLRILDAFRGVSPWVSWGIGIILAIAVLYYGVPLVMEPDPPQAFGLYLMTSVLLFLITGLARFLLAWYLQGRFTKLEPIISSIVARLPF